MLASGQKETAYKRGTANGCDGVVLPTGILGTLGAADRSRGDSGFHLFLHVAGY